MIALMHFSRVSRKLYQDLSSLVSPVSVVSIPHFARASNPSDLSFLVQDKILIDINSVLAELTKRYIALSGDQLSRYSWKWDLFSPATRLDALIQIERFDAYLDYNRVEKMVFIDAAVEACFHLATQRQIRIAIWGIFPHSFYDYLFMRVLEYKKVKQAVLQEFSYAPSCSFVYGSDFQQLNCPKELYMSSSILEVAASDITKNVLAFGKGVSLNDNISSGNVSTYKHGGFERELSNAYRSVRSRDQLDLISCIESYMYRTGSILQLSNSLAILRDRVSSLIQKGYKRLVVVYLSAEPELTICPLSHRYRSCLEYINDLQRYLPSNFGILLKEHPVVVLERLPESIQEWTPNLESIRPARLIEYINQNPRFEWCPYGVSLNQIQEVGIEVIATTAGTVGFEASVLGMNVLCTSDAPYTILDNVIHIGQCSPDNLETSLLKATLFTKSTTPKDRAKLVIAQSVGICSSILNGEIYTYDHSCEESSDLNLVRLVKDIALDEANSL